MIHFTTKKIAPNEVIVCDLKLENAPIKQ